MISGHHLFQMRRNRVDVCGLRPIGEIGSRPARFVDQLLEEEMRAVRAFDFENGVERVDPFASFQRIDVLKAVHSGLGGERTTRTGWREIPNRIMTGNRAESRSLAPKVSREIMDIGPEAGLFMKKAF